jgi:hypothetical protein
VSRGGVVAVAVVADAIGVLAILDVVIMVSVKMVAAIKEFLLLFLLRRLCIPVPSTNTMDKGIFHYHL